MWVQLLQIKKTYKIMLLFPGPVLNFHNTQTQLCAFKGTVCDEQNVNL